MGKYVGYKPGQFFGKVLLKSGEELIIRVPKEEDIAEIREMLYPVAKKHYIPDRLSYPDLETAQKRYKRAIRLTKKGKQCYFIGLLNGRIILAANYFITEIKSGEFKGKIAMELGISIANDYQKKGIGGQLFDFFIKKAKEMGAVYIMGRFFHENFNSLVLCKSRKLKIYRIDKNNPPHDKGWKKDFFKWGKPFNRVNARLLILEK